MLFVNWRCWSPQLAFYLSWTPPVVVAVRNDQVSYPVVFEVMPGTMWVISGYGNLRAVLRDSGFTGNADAKSSRVVVSVPNQHRFLPPIAMRLPHATHTAGFFQDTGPHARFNHEFIPAMV